MLELAAHADLDIVCLQETRLADESVKAATSGARAASWQFVPGPPTFDSRGNPTAGVAFLSQWPLEVVAGPDDPRCRGRFLVAKVHRPRCRPFLLANAYLPASSVTEAGYLAAFLLEWLKASGEEFALLGDYNLEVSRWPLSSACSSGAIVGWDDLHVLEPQGTHRDSDGELTGYTIDFGVGTRGLVTSGRLQLRGPADHDLVAYDLQVASRPVQHVWTRYRPLQDSEASAAWETSWTPLSERFAETLAAGEIDEAWHLLSGAAEQTLAQETLKQYCARSAVAGPRLEAMHSGKAPSFQSLRERRLRRLARRTAELAKQPDDRCLAKRILTARRDFEEVWPTVPLATAEAAQHFHQLAEQAARECRDRRVARWKREIQEDASKLSAWIGQAVPVEEPPAHHKVLDPDPTTQATEAARMWELQWCPLQRPDAAKVARLCAELGAPKPEWELPPTSPAALQARAKQSRKRAAGLDGWRPAHFACLGFSFFQALGALWDVCLRDQVLPVAWKQIRVTLIAKASGGSRPLSIATAGWRLCMAVTMRALRGWVRSWVPPELCGGVPDASIHTVHSAIFQDLFAAHRDKKLMVGCKADIKRCFDSTSPELATLVWRWLGAPRALCGLIEHYYAGQFRWLSVRGVYCPRAVPSTCSLLQGCPASPALLNGLMAVWLRTLKRDTPMVKVALFLDDRTLWSSGSAAVASVVQAARTAKALDADLGLTTHEDKLECFGTTQDAREALFEEAELVGTPQDTFKLLGVTYHVRADACTCAGRLTEVMRRRAKRITMAARSVSLRIALLLSLVVTLFRWLGPWQKFTQTVMTDWARIIEHAVWGGPPPTGRSRALFWCAVASPGLHPVFALAFSALMWEWRRHSSSHALQATSPGPRAASAFELLGWRVSSVGWDTPFGLVRPGWVSLKHVRFLAEQSWMRVMWESDSKVEQGLPGGLHPDFAVARRLAARGVDRYLLRVVSGAAVDGRQLARLQLPANCVCGASDYDRHHATFDCPTVPWMLEKRSADERRTLVPLVPMAVRSAVAPPAPDPELVAHLRDLCEPVLLAIDGSCLVSAVAATHQRAAWGVASIEGCKFSGLVPEVENTPAAGERAALWQAVAAARAAQVRSLRLLCDNEGVVLRVRRGLQGSWEGDCFAFWASIALLIPSDTCIEWVPSHGKLAQWQPPQGWPPASLCRLYNQWADEAAGAVTKGLHPEFAQAVARISEGRHWAETASLRQWRATAKAMEAVRGLYAHDFAKEILAISPTEGGADGPC